jgi:hypothetical protein
MERWLVHVAETGFPPCPVEGMEAEWDVQARWAAALGDAIKVWDAEDKEDELAGRSYAANI